MLFFRPLALLSLLFLASCGFKPVYSGDTARGASAELSAIAVPTTSDRTTQLVRNSLIEQFSNEGEVQSPRYILTITVTESNSSVLVRRSTDIQRSNLSLNVEYSLRASGNKAVLSQGRTVSSASYNRVSTAFGAVQPSEFANIRAEKDARKKAAVAVSDDISRRLAAYFAGRT